MADAVEVRVSYEPDRDHGFIGYNDESGTRLFTAELQFQHGPIGENGHNGVQNEDVLNLLAVRLRTLNERFPCRENSLAITKIEEALFWLEHRTKLRREQGVEGVNLPHRS